MDAVETFLRQGLRERASMAESVAALAALTAERSA
jgi:hypothetical protein